MICVLISEQNKVCILTLTTEIYKKKRLTMGRNHTASFLKLQKHPVWIWF